MFCVSERRNFGLWHEIFFCGVAKTAIEMSIGIFLGIFWKVSLHFSIFGRAVKTCITSVNMVILKNCLLFSFFHFRSSSKKSGLFYLKIRQGFQNCVLRVQKNISTRYCFFIEDCFREHIWTMGKVFAAKLSKLQSTCPKKSFKENFFLPKNETFLNLSWQWVKKLRPLAKTFFYRFVKTAI